MQGGGHRVERSARCRHKKQAEADPDRDEQQDRERAGEGDPWQRQHAQAERGGHEAGNQRRALAGAVAQATGQRRRGAYEHGDEDQSAGCGKGAVVRAVLEVLLGKEEAADHDCEGERGKHRCGSHIAVAKHASAAAQRLLVGPRWQEPCDGKRGKRRKRDKTHQSARQPSVTVSAPPSSGPARFDTPEAAPQMPSAAPRRSGGKPLTAPASAAGLTRPAPTPCSPRASSSTAISPASAPAAAPTAKSARPSSARRREPKRSTSIPPGSSAMP